MEEGSSSKTTKRRKKRSFMQRVKRLTKSKHFVSESNFESLEYEYFMRVFKMTRIFEGTQEEKVVFVNNALAQTENREVDCSSNQLVSRVIESLLPLASNTVLERYFDAFTEDLRPICNHGYSSHVLQVLMVIATRHSLQEYNTEEECKHMELCKKWLLKVSKYLLNNIEEYISETYANHVLRTAMYCLAGVPDSGKQNTQSDNFAKDKNNSSFEQNNLLKDVVIPKPTTDPPEEFVHLLEEFFTRVSKWPQFKDFVCNSLQSGYLQCLLTTLHLVNEKQYKVLRELILSECFFSNKKAKVMLSQTALPVLEVIIEKSKPKHLETIYDELFAGRIAKMSSFKPAIFTLTKFLNKCASAELVAKIVSEVLPEIPNILTQHNSNLLVTVCATCARLKAAQSEMFQGMVKAFKCENSLEQLVPALLSLAPLPLENSEPECTRLGSMLVQNLLTFQKPIKVVNSLLVYSPERLTVLLSSQYGSHIASAFCKSEFVGEKNRQRLIQHLMGHFSELAVSKFGSRSFDDIWTVADGKNRVQIAKDLAASGAKVTGSQFGKFVATKVQLQDFCTLGSDKWMERIQSIQTKKNLFEPIIGGKRKMNDKSKPINKKLKNIKSDCINEDNEDE